MDPVIKGYINNLRMEYGKISDFAEKALTELEAGDYELVRQRLEAIKLFCLFFTSQVDSQDKPE